MPRTQFTLTVSVTEQGLKYHRKILRKKGIGFSDRSITEALRLTLLDSIPKIVGEGNVQIK